MTNVSDIKLAIVGTRRLNALPLVEEAVDRFKNAYMSHLFLNGALPFETRFNIKEVVSGGAGGVDTLAEQFAEKQRIPIKVFPPDIGFNKWSQVPALALKARNQQIVDYADAMVAIRLPNNSPGTDDAITRMKAAKKFVLVFDLGLLLRGF